jgi:hypothetical protein
VSTHRSGLPSLARFVLAVAVVSLGIIVLAGATGLLGRAAGIVGGTLSAAVARITTASSPTPAAVAAPDAPSLAVPTEPYTSLATIDVTGTIPGADVGRSDVRIRLYVTVAGHDPATVGEQPVGGSVSFTFPAVTLEPGSNTFTATLVRGTTESDPSPSIAYVLDTEAPALTVSGPKSGATINRATVTVTGRTQARSAILVHNATANASAAATAGSDGSFSVAIALDPGTNALTVTATDPAANTKSVKLNVRRGSGKLTAALSASLYRFSARKLPDPLTVRVRVLDPDGRPLANAAVTFTISIPGVPTITAPATTDGNGDARFSTTIPKGATPGSGPLAVLVHSDEFGDTTDRTVVTITK